MDDLPETVRNVGYEYQNPFSPSPRQLLRGDSRHILVDRSTTCSGGRLARRPSLNDATIAAAFAAPTPGRLASSSGRAVARPLRPPYSAMSAVVWSSALSPGRPLLKMIATSSRSLRASAPQRRSLSHGRSPSGMSCSLTGTPSPGGERTDNL